ncbi:hypothetical protein PTKIN_Ptkin02bG0146500 [Pterospermum kingtungense]
MHVGFFFLKEINAFGSCSSIKAIATSTKNHATEILNAQDSSLPSNPSNVVTWTAPSFDFLKLNVDAGFCKSDGRIVCGMVIRDHAGQVVISASKGFRSFQSPLQAELRAILFGLEIAHQINLLVQLVKSDSSLAIWKIQKGNSSSSRVV